jgi:PAS domain S-box-containing protein
MGSSTQEQWLNQIGHVLETLNHGVIINDDQKRVVFANAIFLEMIQMPSEKLLGHTITTFYPPEDVPSLLELIGRREAEGRARYEFYIPQAGGRRLPVAVTARQIYGDDGHAYSVVTATDISEQKRAEMELRHANALLLERQRQIQEELALAERIQQSLVPKSLTWGGISVEAYYQPAGSIGGDYGLVLPNEGRLDVLVCDVSGHGISSALVANRIYSETMAQIEGGSELGAMLKQLNHFVVQNLQSSSYYFTMAAARFNEDCRRLQFAGAGHPPAMIAQPGKPVRLLESNSMVLGLFENAIDAHPVTETCVDGGERLLIYTDGLIENFNSQGEMLGIAGLQGIVADTCHLPLPEMKREILDRVTAWRHGPPTDDVSLVLVEVP